MKIGYYSLTNFNLMDVHTSQFRRRRRLKTSEVESQTSRPSYLSDLPNVFLVPTPNLDPVVYGKHPRKGEETGQGI